jgi:hypothetical protein
LTVGVVGEIGGGGELGPGVDLSVMLAVDGLRLDRDLKISRKRLDLRP